MKKENNTETMDINTEPMSEIYRKRMHDSFDRFKEMISSPNAINMLDGNIMNAVSNCLPEDPDGYPACNNIFDEFHWLCDCDIDEFSSIPKTNTLNRLRSMGNTLNMLASASMDAAIKNGEEARITSDRVHNDFYAAGVSYNAPKFIDKETLENLDSLKRHTFLANNYTKQGNNLLCLRDAVYSIYNEAMQVRIFALIEKDRPFSLTELNEITSFDGEE